MRLFWSLIAVLLAAAFAALLVLPDSARLKDVIGWEPSAATEEVNLKDDSRVPSAGGDSAPGAQPAVAGGGGMPELMPILVDQLPFETACGLFLTTPDSRDVIFMMPEASAGQAGAVAALNIEGNLVLVRRSEMQGEPIGHGAYPRQLFRSDDGALTVVATVGTGSPVEADRVAIESGELTVMMAGRSTLKVPVAGAAGC